MYLNRAVLIGELVSEIEQRRHTRGEREHLDEGTVVDEREYITDQQEHRRHQTLHTPAYV